VLFNKSAINVRLCLSKDFEQVQVADLYQYKALGK
jgi:hypothetical protein